MNTISFFHNHSIVNVDAKVIKSLFLIHDFGVVNVVLKCKYIYIYICHVHLSSKRSIEIICKIELKFVFLSWITA